MNFYFIGGLGHIGSYLIKEIPKSFPKSNFIIIDNLSTSRYSSLFNLEKKFKYKFIHSDIKKFNLKKLLKKDDVVIHLAALTNAWQSYENPGIIRKENYSNTKSVVDACSKSKCNLIFTSSTSVYDTKKEIINENCKISELKPDSPYSKVKLEEENFIKKKSKKFKFNYLILRLGTIAGTSQGMRFHTAVNKFCWQAVYGIPLSVWRNFYKISRPYLDLKDLTLSIIYLIKKNINNKTLNLVTENLTTKELIDKIKYFNPNAKINFELKKNFSPNSFIVENKEVSKLGFKFKGNIKKRIFDTLCLLKGSSNLNK